jgi:hypothetical protein
MNKLMHILKKKMLMCEIYIYILKILPPKKKQVPIQLNNNTLPYSAKKNIAKEIAEYSTL